MSNIPAVSVVLPVRGDGRFLDEAITSIINQTFADFELIIVDNGLDKERREVIRRSIVSDLRVRIFFTGWRTCSSSRRGLPRGTSATNRADG